MIHARGRVALPHTSTKNIRSTLARTARTARAWTGLWGDGNDGAWTTSNFLRVCFRPPDHLSSSTIIIITERDGCTTSAAQLCAYVRSPSIRHVVPRPVPSQPSIESARRASRASTPSKALASWKDERHAARSRPLGPSSTCSSPGMLTPKAVLAPSCICLGCCEALSAILAERPGVRTDSLRVASCPCCLFHPSTCDLVVHFAVREALFSSSKLFPTMIYLVNST